MRPRRSMLFIPGANAAMLSTSFVYGADAVMFDLEDAVALREKDTARLLVHHALQHPVGGQSILDRSESSGKSRKP